MNLTETANLITSFVQNLGFPIAVCVACFWYIARKDKQHSEELAEKDKKHEAEIEKLTETYAANTKSYTEELEKVRDALNNNTLVITRLCEKFGKDES